MRGSCTSFAIAVGAFRDRSPKSGGGKIIPLPLKCGVSKDNRPPPAIALARQAEGFLIPGAAAS